MDLEVGEHTLVSRPSPSSELYHFTHASGARCRRIRIEEDGERRKKGDPPIWGGCDGEK